MLGAYPWMGAKFYEQKWIFELMPKHSYYYEAFFGSGILLLNKPPADESFANDINSRLVNFWLCLQDEDLMLKLQKKCSQSLDSRYIYQIEMTKWKGFGEMDTEKEINNHILDMAYNFLYLVKFGFNCFDKETEILTNSGWKYFKDLEYSDKVATTDGKNLYYEHPSEIQNYDYEGEMVRVKHRSVDLLVTPNHNLYVRQGGRKEYEFVKAEDISFRHTRFLNSINWNSNKKEVITGYNTKDFLEFLGWYISEGFCINSKDKHYRIGIAQSKSYNKKLIRDLLDRMKIHYMEQRNQFIINNKQLYNYLKPLGKAHQKYLPQEFMNLSKDMLEILFNTLIKGDGHTEKGGRRKYYTTSKKLADQLQEIIIKLGFNSTLRVNIRQKVNEICGKKVKNIKPIYILNIRKTKECVSDATQHYSRELYKGKVYCCTVNPYHTVLVRRKGRPTWCGQSYPNTYYTPLTHKMYKIKNFSRTFRLTARRLPKYFDIIKDVRFTNYDFREFLQKCEPNKGKFIFLDPPYYETHQYNRDYGIDSPFEEKDYLDMRNLLEEHTEGGTMWMITCNQTNPFFDDMKNIKTKLVDRRACINKNKDRANVKTKIIWNYDLHKTGRVDLNIEKAKQGGVNLI